MVCLDNGYFCGMLMPISESAKRHNTMPKRKKSASKMADLGYPI